MKQTLLPTEPSKYRKALLWKTAMCIWLLVLMLLINFLSVITRTEENHGAHLALNIVTDIAVLSFLLAYVSIKLLPMSRLLGLACSSETGSVSGIVKTVGDTEHIERFECIPVTLDNDRRIFLVSDGKIRLSEGQSVKITTVGHFALEVEHD